MAQARFKAMKEFTDIFVKMDGRIQDQIKINTRMAELLMNDYEYSISELGPALYLDLDKRMRF